MKRSGRLPLDIDNYRAGKASLQSAVAWIPAAGVQTPALKPYKHYLDM
jgi:hypothetical protein